MFLSILLVCGCAGNVIGMEKKSCTKKVHHANLQVTHSEYECPYTKYKRLYEGIKNDLFENGGVCINQFCQCNKFSQNFFNLKETLIEEFSFMSNDWVTDEIHTFFKDIQNAFRAYCSTLIDYASVIHPSSDLYDTGLKVVNEKSQNGHFLNDDMTFFKMADKLYYVNIHERGDELLELKSKFYFDLDEQFTILIDNLTQNNCMMQFAHMLVGASECTFDKLLKERTKDKNKKYKKRR